MGSLPALETERCEPEPDRGTPTTRRTVAYSTVAAPPEVARSGGRIRRNEDSRSEPQNLVASTLCVDHRAAGSTLHLGSGGGPWVVLVNQYRSIPA